MTDCNFPTECNFPNCFCTGLKRKEARRVGKPMKPCNQQTCRTLIPYDQQYCGQHTHLKRERHRRYDAAREREEPHIRAFYNSMAWRNLAYQTKLRDDFLCVKCLSKGMYIKADVADHIIEIKDDWDKRLDYENTQSLCHACHNQKTRAERERREVPHR